MIEIRSVRVKGIGMGTKIGFPTINFLLKELPDGVDLGLWAIATLNGNGFSLISKVLTGYRIETHILNNNVNIGVNTTYTIFLIKKLRDFKLYKDRLQMIDDDRLLTIDYFNGVDTCYNCELYFEQDYGYSNYTVEGSTVGCYIGKFDDIESGGCIHYSAVGCEFFKKGDMWVFDCDGYNERPPVGWVESTVRDAKLKILGI